MKPNQEISLKFWIAMIVFFAVVLSIPLMSYLIDKNIISHSDVSAFYYVCFTSVSCFYMILVLRYSELKQKLSKDAFFNKVSAQTIEDYEHQIKLQAAEITERKKYFEDAIVEISKLTSQVSALKEVNNMLLNVNEGQKCKITYWKERALHQKHTKKVVESDMWECISDNMSSFVKGIKYRDSGRKTLSSLIWLENDGHTYLTHKKNFKHVKC